MGLEAKQGIKVILLYRLLKKETQEDAWKMAYQTEHTIGLSRDASATATKDGQIQSLGQVEYDASATSIIAQGDPHVKELKKAVIDGEIIELWEIDKAEKGTAENSEKYEATYYQGYITNFETTPNSEDAIELSLEFAINGIGQEGYTDLTEGQADLVQYVFKDTAKVATPEETE